MKVIHIWIDDVEKDMKYATIALNDNERVDVKIKPNGFIYILDAPSGNVYLKSDINKGIRTTSDAEYNNIIEFATNNIVDKIM